MLEASAYNDMLGYISAVCDKARILWMWVHLAMSTIGEHLAGSGCCMCVVLCLHFAWNSGLVVLAD